jgi:hypothetical protein
MPADNYGQIFDLESAIEAAAAAILDQAILEAGLSAEVYTQRSEQELVWPFISAQFTPGAHNGHSVRCPDGRIREAGWSGRLAFRIETERSLSNGAHLDLRKIVRVAMADPDTEFTGTRLPFHSMALTTAGSTPVVQVEDNIDVSELVFEADVFVRADAFPTEPEPEQD